MSDTPRTDAAWELYARGDSPMVIRMECAKIERDNAALRAALDPERIIAEIGLPGGYYYDPQAIADAIRVYCRAALTAGGAK